ADVLRVHAPPCTTPWGVSWRSIRARNDPIAPTEGSVLRIGVVQSIPVGQGSIFMNRLRGSYSRYFPVNWTNFSEGAEALAFNIQGGIVLGDLPPYEAFAIGGTNSVRGYGEGEVGSGRYFVQGTAEYRFPVFTIGENIPIGGVLFVDVGSDLGSADQVPGNPAGARRKPGTGVGAGVGVRARTPFGPIRLDFGVNDDGDTRLHFGIGERF
ncbi:MAG: BamA/TamA family outer membrane protein, partial [Cyanobacteria bacterium P01_H01_bin.130]